MSAHDQYLARANACAEDAKNSNLENVRDRNLRSEAVWRSMADRELRIQREREQKAAPPIVAPLPVAELA